MIRKFTTILFLLMAHSAIADTWLRFLGSRGWDRAAGFTETKDGGFLIAGSTESLDHSRSNPLIVKFDSHGSPKWQRILSVQGINDAGASIDETLDGGFILTGAGVTKLSSSGDVEWSRRFAGVIPGFANGISDGGSIVVGYRNRRAWVGKLNAAGSLEWERTYSCGITPEVAQSVLETSDGNFLIGALTYCKAPYVGVNLIKIDPSGEVLWRKIYSTSDITLNERHTLIGVSETDDGGYILALNANFHPKLLKLDGLGNVIWSRFYDFDFGGGASPTEIDQTRDGGYIFAYGNRLLKVNAAGDVEWFKIFGRLPGLGLVGLTQQKDGNYVIAGLIRRKQRGTDLLIFKVDGNGNLNLPCIRVQERSLAATPANIEVFSNVRLNNRLVKSAARNQIVTVSNFVSDQNGCRTN